MKMVALWSKSTKSTFPNIILSRQNRFWTFILCPFSNSSANSFSYFYGYIYNYLNIKRTKKQYIHNFSFYSVNL